MAYFSLILPVLLVTIFAQSGESVRCWKCSSDENPLCNDPYLGGSDNSYLYSIENCYAHSESTYPDPTALKSVCKKHERYIDDQLVISRGCTWKPQDDYSTACPISDNGPEDITKFCETCEYDLCNGAVNIGKTLVLVLGAPLVIFLLELLFIV